MSAPRGLRQAIERKIANHGGLRAAARVLKTDPSYLLRCMTGARGPSPKLLRGLGLVKVVGYRKHKP